MSPEGARDWPKYILGALLAVVGLLMAYVIVDQTGTVHRTETVRVNLTSHAEAWTQHQTISVPIGDHGETMDIPQTVEWPETWTFRFETLYGTVSGSFTWPEAEELLCCEYIRVHYRLGRLSHGPIDLTVERR